jgi:hypothetical protein
MDDSAQQQDGEQQPPVVEVGGITATDYAMWYNNDPVAQMLMQYLRDFKADIEQSVLAMWANGSLTPEYSQDMRGFARALGDIESIRIEGIAEFYAQQAKMRAAAAEAEQEARKAMYG